VSGLAVDLTSEEVGTLTLMGVNCLRQDPVVGPVVWGARTAAGADATGPPWRYLSVRRTALFIEDSVVRSIQWVVFEPNGEPLWASIRATVTTFLDSLFRAGAFQGVTAKDAYFVRCDRSTTTRADIDRGVVNIVIGFAALKPAEFVIIGIQQASAPQM
jgi:phage tail sheath protein FI